MVAVVAMSFALDGAEVKQCLDVVNDFHYVVHGDSDGFELRTR